MYIYVFSWPKIQNLKGLFPEEQESGQVGSNKDGDFPTL